MLSQLENKFKEIFQTNSHMEAEQKREIERHNLFCEGITEQASGALNNLVDARDEKDFPRLGRLICSLTLGYELNCLESELKHDELYHYVAIRAGIQDAGIAPSETDAEQEINEYECRRNKAIDPYTRERIKKALELYLSHRSIEEK